MTYPCPFCRTPADPATGCPGCGRGPDADAAEVVRLDAEMPVLAARLQTARDAATSLDAQLREAWRRRQAAAARVRAKVHAEHPPVAAEPPAPGSLPPGVTLPLSATLPPLPPRAARAPEASTRLVQNALFLLGGLLLGVAAIVFTAVAWTTFGVGGRAALLAGFTAVALSVPPLVRRRSLNATAETFAAVGLLLVLLDGYAAWAVNLFGVADVSGWGYAGAVCAVTAAVAVGYEHSTGLIGPRFAALLAAQPVLPLLLAQVRPATFEAWAFMFAALAALNVAVIHAHRDRRGTVALLLRLAAYALGGVAVLGSIGCAVAALVASHRVVEAAEGGAALVTAALVLVAAAVSARSALARATAGGLLVGAVGLAAGRCAALADAWSAPVSVAAVVLLLAGVVAGTARFLPAAARRGPWIGAVLVVAGPALVAAAGAIDAAARTLSAARPVFAAAPAVPGTGVDLRLPATIVLLSAAAATLLPRRHRLDAALTGAALGAVTAPAALGLAWWYAPVVNLLVAAGAAALALRAAGGAVPGQAPFRAAVALGLVAHAIAAGYGLPGAAASTLGAVVLLGLGTAVAGWRIPARRTLGGGALTMGLLAVPAAVAAAVAAVDLAAPWQSRAALGAAAVLSAVTVAARRWLPYRAFALAAVLLAVPTAPMWAVRNGEPIAVYAAVALLLIALALTGSGAFPGPAPVTAPAAATGPAAASGSAPVTGSPVVTEAAPVASAAAPIAEGPVLGVRGWSAVAAILPAVALLATAAESVLTVLLAPYGWLDRVWTGRPGGVGAQPIGIDPAGTGAVSAGVAVGMLLLGVATVVLVRAHRGWRAAGWAAVPPIAVAVPIALAAAGAAWPVVPAVTLGVGLAFGVTIALRRVPETGTAASAAVAVALTGAGLAGTLPTHLMTLVGLGAVGVAGAVCGAAGRSLPARVTGWLTAVAAAVAFAYTAGRAGQLGVPATAFGVLAVAAAALAFGAALSGRRGVEGRAVQAAAHAGAVVALLLTAESARYAAVVCTLWGVAVGLRALRPGESADRRRIFVVAAAATELLGWWLLVAAEGVSVPEAYTLPAAAVALLAGALALRSRPELTSWTAYGPALAAALLPSLAAVLVGGDGDLLRRFLLGTGALTVVLSGAFTRRQAPVLVGGGVLVAVALHELVLVWELVPRWIPLAVGGLILVGLAMTLERGRRDLARVRAAVGRMS